MASCPEYVLGSLEISSFVGMVCFLFVFVVSAIHYKRTSIRVHVYITVSTGMNGIGCLMSGGIRQLAACCSPALQFLEIMVEEVLEDGGYFVYILLIISRVKSMGHFYRKLPKYYVSMNIVAISLLLSVILSAGTMYYYTFLSQDMDQMNSTSDIEGFLRNIAIILFFLFNFIMNYIIARGVIRSTLEVLHEDKTIVRKAKSLYIFLSVSMLLTTSGIIIFCANTEVGNTPLNTALLSLSNILFPAHFLAEWYYQKALSDILNQSCFETDNIRTDKTSKSLI